MKTYTLLGPHTDGKRQLRAGDPIELTDAQAQWMYQRGAIAIDGVSIPRPVVEIPALLRKPVAPQRCCGWK